MASRAFKLCYFKNDDSDFLSEGVKMVSVKKVDPEPLSSMILPEKVADILQFAHACSQGIITPEELGVKLAEFEAWLDSVY